MEADAEQVAQRVGEQAAILAEGARYVKPGGTLVYITCSVLDEENAGQIASFRAAHPEFAAIDSAAGGRCTGRRRAGSHDRGRRHFRRRSKQEPTGSVVHDPASRLKLGALMALSYVVNAAAIDCRSPRTLVVTVIFIALVVTVGSVIGINAGPDTWYAALQKPPFNPPNWLFAPVWFTLYVLIGIAGARSYLRDAVEPVDLPLGGQMLLQLGLDAHLVHAAPAVAGVRDHRGDLRTDHRVHRGQLEEDRVSACSLCPTRCGSASPRSSICLSRC